MQADFNEIIREVLTDNEVTMQALRAGTLETREILKMQLSKENLSKEERSELNNMLLEVLRMEYEKDTENKKHGQGIRALISRAVSI